MNKSLAVYEHLLLNDPNNLHYLEQRALSFEELADLAKVRGSISKAINLQTKAMAIFKQVAESAPENVEYRRNLRNSYLAAAAQFETAGEAENEIEASRNAMQISQQLSRQAKLPEIEINRLISGARLYIGIGEIYRGDYKRAIDELRAALESNTDAQTQNPNNTGIKYSLWLDRRYLAEAEEMSGEMNSAAEDWNNALSVIEGLLADSPKDAGYHRNSALTHILLGKFLAHHNQTAKALPHFRRALELSNYVLTSIGEYRESEADLASAYANLGWALITTNKVEEGLQNLRKSVEIYQEIYDDNNALLKRDYAEACYLLGIALEKEKNQTEARPFLEKSFALWSEMREKGVLRRADFEEPEKVKKQLDRLANLHQSR